MRAGLATAHGRGVELLREAFATSDAETLHDARKRVVHLRYQLEALMPAWPKYLKSMMREYQTLREHLGDYNDLVNLEAAIGDPTSPLFRTPRRDDWLSYAATRRAQLIRRARNLADRLYAETTDAFTLRIVAYWEAGAREAVDHSVPDLVIDIDDDLDPAAVAAREDITSGS
ncbi:MAG: CHAD domain-containing protein [Pseudomonadota bacterium]